MKKIKDVEVDKDEYPKQWMSPIPTECDICYAKIGDIFYDAKTIYGPWGCLCEKCFKLHGVGLGIGLGQKYDAKTKLVIKGLNE